MSEEKLEFTTCIQQVPVAIDGKEYILSEANGDRAMKWKNAILACATFGPDGKPNGSRNLASTESLLVSLCLRDAESNELVDLQEIRKWPQRVVTALFNKAKEISGLNLDEGSEDAGKNLPSESKDGTE